MQSPISHLSDPERRQLLDDMNYLNMSEIKAFSRKHCIPYAIWIETEDGSRRKTGENDRKGVILTRIRHYLETGEIMDATCFPSSVVCFDDLPEQVRPTDRLFYGQYEKTSDSMLALLKKLTDGKFKNGAIARILAREYWSKGIAPTFREFACEWLRASAEHTRPNPEWAFLSDRTDGRDTSDWKTLRVTKAKRVMTILCGSGNAR